MPWGYAAVAVGGLIGTKMSNDASEDAADTMAEGSDDAITEQRREFDIARQDQAPWLNTGQAALSKLAGLYGLNTAYGSQNFGGAVGGGSSGNPGMAGYETGQRVGTVGGEGGNGQTGGQGGQFGAFYQSPDYQFALNQGIQGLDRSAAARGSLYSGGHGADVMRYAGGLASQQFGNYANRLANLAGVGQSTATNLGNMGMNMASNIGNIGMTNAANQSRSIYQRGNNNAQAAFGLAGMFNNWHQGQAANNPGGSGWYLGNQPGKG